MAMQIPHRISTKFVAVGTLGVLALAAILLAATPSPSSETASTSPGATCDAFLLLAKNDVKLFRPLTSEGNIHANDDIRFYTGGPSTHIGNLTAVDHILIRRANTIEGDVTAGGKIYISKQSTITGTSTEHAAVALIALPTLSFTAGGHDVTVPEGGTRTLDPGSYDDVRVKQHGTLFLKTGAYFMKSLDTRLLSKISVDVTDGPVTINVTKKLEFGPSTEVIITPIGQFGTRDVIFNSMQRRGLYIKRGAKVLGTIIAPYAEVETLSQFNFKGSICAKDIEIGKGATLLYHSPIFVEPTSGVSFIVPPSWSATDIGPPSGDEPNLTAIEAISPYRSQFLVFPNGGYGYGLEDDLIEVQTSIEIDGFQALKRDFIYPDNQVFTRIELSDVPGHPDFRIELLTRNLVDQPTLESILQTVRIRE